MKQYFRIYVVFDQNDWMQYVLFTKFAYNNNKNVFIDIILFETIFDYHFRMLFENFIDNRIKFIFAKKNVKHISQFMIVLKSNLINAQKYQIKYKNAHIKSKQHEKFFYMIFNEKNIQTKRNKKLKWKLFELFKIIEIVDNQIHKLKLFKKWRISFVFHVFLLKIFKI